VSGQKSAEVIVPEQASGSLSRLVQTKTSAYPVVLIFPVLFSLDVFRVQISKNVPRQMLVDFGVSWYRLSLACSRLSVEVVLAAMADELDSKLVEAPQEFAPLHAI